MSPYPLLATLGVVWTWWGWKSGGFFGDVLIPGGIVLAVALAVLLFRSPWPAAGSRPAVVALAALVALAAWTLLSILWSDAQEVAVADAEQVLVYAISFALGGWLGALLGRDAVLAALPLAVAGLAVGVATTASIAVSSDTARYLHEGVLDYPLGYHNAVTAFATLTAFSALLLCASDRLHWGARAVLAGSVTISLGLATLTQSRAAVFAAVVGVLVLVLASRSRLGMVGWIALCAIPLAPTVPTLLDVYTASGKDVEAAADELNRAGVAIALAALATVCLAALAARYERRLVLAPPARRGLGTVVTVVAALAFVVPLGVAVANDGGPGAFVENRIDDLSAGTPDLRESGTRLGFNLGSNRGDLWVVAIDEGAAHPVGGLGAGGFEYSYLQAREEPTEQTSEDPHSVVLLMFSEYGVVGLILFAVFVVSALIGVWRARALGPGPLALSGLALGSFAYWFVHANVDWLWIYPAITAPLMALLGSCCAAGMAPAQQQGGRGRRGWRLTAAAVLIVVAVIQLPLFFSERYLRDGVDTGTGDLASAYSDLDRAADLNPWSPAPLLAEGELATEAGDLPRALAALGEAEQRKPIDWTPHYLAALALAESDPAAARRQLAEARKLNPLGEEILAAEDALDRTSKP